MELSESGKVMLRCEAWKTRAIAFSYVALGFLYLVLAALAGTIGWLLYRAFEGMKL